MLMAGDPVQITPKGKEAATFWAFVDGWTGVVTGQGGGRFTVECQRPDGKKTLYVEPENLTKLWNFGRA